MSIIRLQNFRFKPSALHSFELYVPDLSVCDREWVGVVGPSGCGKSTLLRACIGQLKGYGGSISINAQYSEAGRIGYVSQVNTLWPWLTIEDNIKWGVSQLAVPTDARQLDQLIERLHLTPHRTKYPNQASGGMLRRTMLGRSMLYMPMLLMLDEPFSGIDVLTRLTLIEYLLEERKRRSLSCVLVSHELEDAIRLTDKIYYFDSEGCLANEPFRPVGDARDDAAERAREVERLITMMSKPN